MVMRVSGTSSAVAQRSDFMFWCDGETRIVNIHNGFQAHRFLKYQNTYQKHEACTNKLIGLSPSPKASTRFPIFSPQGITP